MSGLAEKAKLNQVYNEMMDVLDRGGVALAHSEGKYPRYFLLKDGVNLHFNEATRTKAYDNTQPPRDWDEFLAAAIDILAAKNADYDSAFMKALVHNEFPANVIWKWEVKKKLDRIRTWIERRELTVKGESVKDTVLDLFGYTVQYVIYQECKAKDWNPFERLTESAFYRVGATASPRGWVNYLGIAGALTKDEDVLIATILKYMGIPNA